jgi:hypothetical protein
VRFWLPPLLALLAVVAWSSYRTHENEVRLGRIASVLAGRHVGVDCQRLIASLVDVEWREGEVKFDVEGRPGDETLLSRRTCSDLARFRREGDKEKLVGCLVHAPLTPDTLPGVCRSGGRYAGDVKVLAHEAQHLRGIPDEAIAECYAIQRAGEVAAALHVDATYTKLALQTYWAAYPERPPAYRSAECYDGGALDLRPRTHVWP